MGRGIAGMAERSAAVKRVVVPVEPTAEMIDDGNSVSQDAGDIWEPSEGINYNGPSCGLEVWKAMLAAAPPYEPSDAEVAAVLMNTNGRLTYNEARAALIASDMARRGG